MGDVSSIPEAIRLAAEEQGLHRALTMFPDLVKAAAERGRHPLGTHRDSSPLASPAPVFDPARFDSSRADSHR
jgi:hypothetical protein